MVNISRVTRKRSKAPVAAVTGEKGETMDKVMRKATQSLCKTCKYSVGFGAGTVCCDYLNKARKSRGCSVGECDKYERKARRKKKKGSME